MSHHSHLPIYNAAFLMLKEWYHRVPKFAKQYKYLLGGRLIESNIHIISSIAEVSRTRSNTRRIELVDMIIADIELMIIHARIGSELKQFGNETAYISISEKLIDLSHQAEGWKKYLEA